MKNLIFEKPSLAPLSNRIGWAFFTAVFWLIWFYLWMPLLTVLLWWLGFHFFDQYVLSIPAHEVDKLINLIALYTFIIVLLGGSLLVWAGSEFVRFHHVHHRHRPTPVESAELAQFAHLSTAKMAQLSSAHRMVAHHDAHGNFLDAEVT